jgi:hypothetical protein
MRRRTSSRIWRTRSIGLPRERKSSRDRPDLRCLRRADLGPGGRRGAARAEPTSRQWRMFTARAAAMTSVTSERSACIIMRTFPRPETGAVSVGLKAIDVLNATKT